jgi:hypothetical protein
MFRAMTLLNETSDLNSISSQSVSFREFQSFIEAEYFRRRGNEGLVQVAASQGGNPARPTADTKFAPEEGSRSRQPRVAEVGQA